MAAPRTILLHGWLERPYGERRGSPRKEARTVTTEMREPLSIDVNAASADELVAIDGIGPALAQRIVQHRQEKGPFNALEELTKVRGIGRGLLERIRSQITLAPTVDVPLSEPPPPSEPMTEIAASRLMPVTIPEADQVEKTLEQPEEEEVAMTEDQVTQEPTPEDEIPAQETEAQAEAESPELVVDLPQQETEVAIEQAEDIEATAEEIKEEEEPEAEPATAATSDSDQDSGHSFWSNFLLVAAGALVGALVMLLVLLAYSGTLSYASRSQVDALSRNLDTIYQNSEVAWERLDRLAAENADLVAKVDRLMLLSGRVAELEQGMSELRADVGSVEDAMTSLESDLASLRETYDSRLGEMDATMAAQGDLLDRLETSLGEVRETMDGMTARLDRYDDFFGALRDLLIDLQGPPAEGAAEAVEGE